jgi:hypothetical protein
LLYGHIYQVELLCGTCTLLEKTQRGIEVDWDSDLGDILPYRVFDDAPNTDLDLGIFKERQAIPRYEVF